MKILKYSIAMLFTFIFSSSVYAHITELDSGSPDACRKQIEESDFYPTPVVLTYSKDTSSRTFEVFESVANERPNAHFFKFNMDVYTSDQVARLCLGQLFPIYNDFLIMVDNIDVHFMAPGVGSGILSTKEKILAIIDDINQKRLVHIKNKH